jgi:hypothetical protein
MFHLDIVLKPLTEVTSQSLFDDSQARPILDSFVKVELADRELRIIALQMKAAK